MSIAHPKKLRAVIKNNGLEARKSLGQNFLTDPCILDKILEVTEVNPEDEVLEIGPGPGALLERLLPQVQQLFAIEKDRRFYRYLKNLAKPRLTLLYADALEVDYPLFLSAAKGPIKVIANLPYNIATPLILKLLKSAELFEKGLFLMLQKEVAQRICAKPCSKAYSPLSICVQMQAQAQLLFDIPPQSFHPSPKVWSSFIHLKPQLMDPIILLPAFKDFLYRCFAQKRKTLNNNLKTFYPPDRLQIGGVTPQVRAEQLSPQQLATLYRYLEEDRNHVNP